jgi:hypothetical protein
VLHLYRLAASSVAIFAHGSVIAKHCSACWLLRASAAAQHVLVHLLSSVRVHRHQVLRAISSLNIRSRFASRRRGSQTMKAAQVSWRGGAGCQVSVIGGAGYSLFLKKEKNRLSPGVSCRLVNDQRWAVWCHSGVKNITERRTAIIFGDVSGGDVNIGRQSLVARQRRTCMFGGVPAKLNN